MKTTCEKILDAGVALYPDATLQKIADRVGNITRQGIHHHFPNGTLHDAIAEHAVRTKNSRVVLQLMASGHKAVESLSPSERIKHFNAVEN